ncbi:MAG TPA: hypothetical protein VK914_11675 [bacterium]|nr:hypothetical protein [bacterium]
MKAPRILFAAALAPFWPALAGACESCSNALADDPTALGFSKGVYFSIIVMLGVVAGLVALLVGFIVKDARRSDAAGKQGSGS